MVDRDFVNVVRNLIAEDPSIKTDGSFDRDICLSWLTKRVHTQHSHLGDCKNSLAWLIELGNSTTATSFASSETRMQWRPTSLATAEMEAKHKESAKTLMKCLLVLPVRR